jgi:hypothetical protein
MKSELLDSVVALSGLQDTSVKNDLFDLIAKNQFNPDELELHQLREVMADYLNVVFLELANRENKA